MTRVNCRAGRFRANWLSPMDQAQTRFAVTRRAPDVADGLAVEICEHKGVGHPDSICDGVAEAVSRALCRAYRSAYGAVQHYNVDKALLVGGESAPRFGGGRLLVPLRLIVCGRATVLPGMAIDELVRAAALDYLRAHLRCDPATFTVESAVRSGSPNLRRVVNGTAVRLANDTSFGAGYAPYSRLERTVLDIADVLRSDDFRRAFPAAGDDYKIMGARVGNDIRITVALALLDRAVENVAHYFDVKQSMLEQVRAATGVSGALVFNALDDPAARDESGIYLTVAGLSAEHGDDGQVGRGNRVNGLITPLRTMSLEAAAGKNAVVHVGKLYNVLALELARAVSADVPGVAGAAVQILATIGQPVERPALVALDLAVAESAFESAREHAMALARERLADIAELSERLIDGAVRVF